ARVLPLGRVADGARQRNLHELVRRSNVRIRELEREAIVENHVETELRLLRGLGLQESVAERALRERAVRADRVGLVLIGEIGSRARGALRDSQFEFVDSAPRPPRLLRESIRRASAIVRVPLFTRSEQRARVASNESVENEAAVGIDSAGEEIAL